MLERTSNRQKLSNTSTFLVTLQASIKDLSRPVGALRLLRNNPSKTIFKENNKTSLFKQRQRTGGYSDNLIDKTFSDVKHYEKKKTSMNK